MPGPDGGGVSGGASAEDDYVINRVFCCLCQIAPFLNCWKLLDELAGYGILARFWPETVVYAMGVIGLLSQLGI